jgi:hypothetical protein
MITVQYVLSFSTIRAMFGTLIELQLEDVGTVRLGGLESCGTLSFSLSVSFSFSIGFSFSLSLFLLLTSSLATP